MRTLRPMRCFVGPHDFVNVVSSVVSQQSATFLRVAHPRGDYDCQIRTWPRFLYSIPTPKFHHPMFMSFGSYHVDKHIHKQTNKAENMEHSSLCYEHNDTCTELQSATSMRAHAQHSTATCIN